MREEILLPEDCFKHKNKDNTWKIKNWDIEDKIKELRKEIYRLQNSRKKQPSMFVFRTTFSNPDQLVLHIFDGWSIIDEEKGQVCADRWREATPHDVKIFYEKYSVDDMKPEVKQILDKIMEDE